MRLLTVYSLFLLAPAGHARQHDHAGKQEVLKEIQDVHQKLFSDKNVLVDRINFSAWSGEAGMFALVKKFVKRHGHRDRELLSAFNRIKGENTDLEFAIRDIRERLHDSITPDELQGFKVRINKISARLQAISTELKDLRFRILWVDQKEEARDVLLSLAAFVDSVATVVERHLPGR